MIRSTKRTIRKTKRWIAVLIIGFGTGLVATGCDSDEFDEAPAASASNAEVQPGQQPGGDEAGSAGGLGPVQGSELPPDHPPIGAGQDQQGGQGQQAAVPMPEVERPGPSEYGESGPILWEAPSDWNPVQPESSMRFAEYEVPGQDGGAAEVAVFIFPPGGGGGVEGTLQRWVGQFSDGPEATQEEIDTGGLTVHTLDAAGTFESSMGMGASDGPVDDQRLLGAITDTPNGLILFRLIGDSDVVATQVDGFDSFVQSFELGQ